MISFHPLRNIALALVAATTMISCPGDDASGSGVAGEACTSSEECLGDLRCISGVCADLDASSGDAEGDATPALKSYYKIKITTQLGQEYEFDRDISEKPNAYSFGSTHIAPAVSFAISEDLSWPATMTLILNFGIVVGSTRFPVQTDAPGDYSFSSDPPEIDIIIGLRYRSTVAGSTGSVNITEYSNQTDGIMAGTFKGRLLQDTTKADKKWADVEGEFRLILPIKEQGQPG